MAWDNFIDDLKMQVNIVDVIGREVSLKKAGANYKGLCPFHSEKTPSFMVNEERQIFNCFGCGQKGDVIRFVQDYYKIPFMEAVEKLSNEYGIKMPEKLHSAPKKDYSRYYEINAKAARYFYNCLGIRGNKGLVYLKNRGLSRETITKFGLGYAPSSGTALVDYLRNEGVKDEEMLKLGLANSGKSGLYDKFRDRVIFPIINTQDKVIGFGGRAIGGDIKPKYLNSPESEIFLKKNNLFGLNFTRSEISSEGRAVIVEGYMDVISLYQSGIRNVAASLGTALTDNQARLLCRYSKNIVLSYDSDNAGINAALRGISVITAAGGKPRILTVTDGKDPDEFVQKNGKEAFLKLVDQAVPAAEFRLELARRGHDLSTDTGVLEYIDSTIPILRSLGPVEQDMYIRRLSEEFGISDRAILMSVQTESGGRQNTPVRDNYSAQKYRQSRRGRQGQTDPDINERIEMSFVMLALSNTRYLERFRKDDLEFRSELASHIISAAESMRDTTENGMHRLDVDIIARALDPDEETRFRKYASSVHIGADDEAFYRETTASYLINNYKMEKSELRSELAIAEKTGRQDEIERIADRLILIDKLINEAYQTMEENNA